MRLFECIDNLFKMCLVPEKYQTHDIDRFYHQTRTEHHDVTSQNWSDTTGTPKWVERNEKLLNK